jgi:hypothetical protein
MSTILYLNDTPAENYGLGLRSANWWDSVVFERPSIALAGQLGQVAGNVGIGAPRELSITALLEATSVNDRRTKLDNIARDLSAGVNEIRIQDDTARVLLARFIRYTVGAFSENPYGGQPYVEVTLEFVADDPVWKDKTASSYAVTTSGVDIPLGSLPNYGVIELTGASSPTITYKAHTGSTVATLALSYTWATGETYRVDLGLQTIDKVVAGVRTNAISAYSTGDFFDLDPVDADAGSSSSPSLTVSTGTATFYYRRSWA